MQSNLWYCMNFCFVFSIRLSILGEKVPQYQYMQNEVFYDLTSDE